ncbi:MAG: orotate phosphoribosyltransferase [Proteobacteria bacterium]|nr:orotate phosphoribosyltransferase [Pseudomonadota bacterium]
MDQNLKKRLMTLLLEKSIKYSDTPEFKLASGRMSDFYVDCRKVTHNAEGKYLIGNIIFALIQELPVQAIGGLTLGADPIASAVAYTAFLNKKKINSFVIRKERKEHGLKKLVEGDVQPGDRVVIVDDVITTGGSTIRAIEAAREEGLEVVKTVVLVDREEGGREEIVKCISSVEALFTKTELLEAYRKARGV